MIRNVRFETKNITKLIKDIYQFSVYRYFFKLSVLIGFRSNFQCFHSIYESSTTNLITYPIKNSLQRFVTSQSIFIFLLYITLECMAKLFRKHQKYGTSVSIVFLTPSIQTFLTKLQAFIIFCFPYDSRTQLLDVIKC